MHFNAIVLADGIKRSYVKILHDRVKETAENPFLFSLCTPCLCGE